MNNEMEYIPLPEEYTLNLKDSLMSWVVWGDKATRHD